ncbi:MAG TPA: heme exporter protein CcmD [Steroidobacteraceae bacterium]|nr:heme exporter protein CcmD [Steroidobacteraceae bacterium]
MSDFFAMGGYGIYLWPSFALGIGVILLNVILAVRTLAAAKLEARRRLEMQS